MNIDVIAVGGIKEKYLREALKEYLKRLGAYADVNIKEIDEYKLGNDPAQAEIDKGMEKEGQAIIGQIKPRSYVIALCVEGKQFSSEDFSARIEEAMVDGYSDIAFVIGGSFGLSQDVKKLADLKLSFSKMTFPHQLMRVVLLEQVYRAFRIMRNEPYHK